jgi:deoxyribonuclease IV
MKLGTHCSVKGRVVNGLHEAKRLGCDTVQIFTRSPRMWRSGKINPEAAADFRRIRKELKLDPVVVHTPYLPNLCTSVEALYQRSYQALLEDLEHCEMLSADYLVIHPGAHSDGVPRAEGVRRLADAISRGLAERPGKTIVLLENMAGGGRRMGMAFEELAAMRSAIQPKERVGICLDTAHTLAGGYGLSSADEVNETLQHFDRTIGLDHLKVIHANDSKTPRGSHRDRHEHIGQGHVGKKAFQALINHPRLKEIPFILETPKETPEDDPRNLTVMRGLALPTRRPPRLLAEDLTR